MSTFLAICRAASYTPFSVAPTAAWLCGTCVKARLGEGREEGGRGR